MEALSPLPGELFPSSDPAALVEDVVSRRSQLPMAVSAMDGYAVRAADVATLPADLAVVGQALAGHAFDGRSALARPYASLPAPLPDGADTIVIQENTEQTGETVRVTEGEAPVGRFVRPAGLDFASGDTLLKGKALTARDIGLPP